MREDLIVDAPSSCRFAEEGYLIFFCEGVFDLDLVAGIGAEEVLPAQLHLFSTGKTVAACVGEGMVVGHQDAQARRIFCVDGGDEGASYLVWSRWHGCRFIAWCR